MWVSRIGSDFPSSGATKISPMAVVLPFESGASSFSQLRLDANTIHFPSGEKRECMLGA
jgi:hypothetical protein